jgi:hypothetical protein
LDPRKNQATTRIVLRVANDFLQLDLKPYQIMTLRLKSK